MGREDVGVPEWRENITFSTSDFWTLLTHLHAALRCFHILQYLCTSTVAVFYKLQIMLVNAFIIGHTRTGMN